MIPATSIAMRSVIDLSVGTVDIGSRPLLAVTPSCRYAPPEGLSELRDLIAVKERVERENVIVTAGAAAALSSAFSLMRSGGTVLLPRPFFPPYQQLARIFGLHTVFYDASIPPSDATLRSIEALIDNRCCGVVWNYPHSPSGNVVSNLDLTRLSERCSDFGAILLTDHVYEDLVLDDLVLSEPERLFPTEIRIKSFSKSHALAGERVGYALADESLILRLRDNHFSLVGPTSWAGQLMAMGALSQQVAEWLASRRAKLREARDRVHSELISIPGLSPNFPLGGVFFWLRVDGVGASRFCEILLAEGVRVAPGSLFGDSSDSYCRICFAVRPNVMQVALRQIRLVAENFANSNKSKERSFNDRRYDE